MNQGWQNASHSIEMTFESVSNVKDEKEQQLNAHSQRITLTDEGIQMGSNPVHSENAPNSIRVCLEPDSNVNDGMEEQSLKHSLPSTSTDHGIQTDFSVRHL
jgi:hypothetical protein